ncbi:MAG: hypothetical protein WC986_13545 [Elusimicrobiota bacterium]|jgi:hypothetical protein
MSSSDIAYLRALCDAATPGEWRLCATEPNEWNRDEFLKEMADIWDRTDSVVRHERFWMIQATEKDGTVNIAIVGNGPRSETHSRLIQCAPWLVNELANQSALIESMEIAQRASDVALAECADSEQRLREENERLRKELAEQKEMTDAWFRNAQRAGWVGHDRDPVANSVASLSRRLAVAVAALEEIADWEYETGDPAVRDVSIRASKALQEVKGDE